MADSFHDKLAEYAQLLVRAGVDIKQGQSLVINAPAEEIELVRLITKAAYDAGCHDIYYTWTDNELTRLRYLGAEDSAFDEFPSWRADMLEQCSAKGYSRISVVALEPELFTGIDTARVMRSMAVERNATTGYSRRQSSADFPWCLCASPTKGWAALAFPELNEEEGRKALWDLIFETSRVGGGQAVARWRQHGDALCGRTKKLDALKLIQLRYKTGIGTDLTVKLPEGHFWLGGDTRCTRDGRLFFPNIPTEENATIPHKYGVDGTIVASKPLVLNGTVVDGIRMELVGGKIVNATAEKNEEVLIKELDSDEGARYLGEAALVPFDSPINKIGRLFYHTLFDENAVSHFAFGHAYPCINGAADMTDEQLDKAGVNISGTHTDFMVGTADMLVVGTTFDGQEVTIMKDGVFAL